MILDNICTTEWLVVAPLAVPVCHSCSDEVLNLL